MSVSESMFSDPRSLNCMKWVFFREKNPPTREERFVNWGKGPIYRGYGEGEGVCGWRYTVYQRERESLRVAYRIPNSNTVVKSGAVEFRTHCGV